MSTIVLTKLETHDKNINKPTHQVKLARPQGGNWRCKMYPISEYVTDAIYQTSTLPLFHLSEHKLHN